MVQQNIVQDRLQDLFPVHYRNGNILMINADCMDVMAHIQDNEAELSCVDPPYGLGKRLSQGAGKLKDRRLQVLDSSWDTPPDEEYFTELFRVSKNQIIWGGNYFPLPPTRCVLCWDKEQPWENFSQWEMAWTSFDSPAALFRMNNAFKNPGKIHATQKPVALYKWLLSRFAKPGDKILDTHGGSGSSCIASHEFGYDMVWMEADKGIYESAVARYKDFASQATLFDPVELTKENAGGFVFE